MQANAEAQEAAVILCAQLTRAHLYITCLLPTTSGSLLLMQIIQLVELLLFLLRQQFGSQHDWQNYRWQAKPDRVSSVPKEAQHMRHSQCQTDDSVPGAIC